MNTFLSEGEIVLCITALRTAADDLMEGLAAAGRLNVPLDANIPEAVKNMRALADRLMAEAMASAA
jgi:hypothetical protein